MAFETILHDLNFEIILRLLVAIGLGAVIGFERELKNRPAGLRTHMLVCLGSAIFTTIGLGLEPNTSRIAEAIVTGIGFLGAGAIIASGGQVRGITSAATLWVVASVGLVVGVGQYPIAIIITGLIFGILQIDRIKRFSQRGMYDQ
ncbi:MAG TPA: MgtC/SapB family protein [Nitrosopumilaceae archaeon]|nr:MgtC/SapB family protein [Nitrosopumilaceae archaeon]